MQIDRRAAHALIDLVRFHALRPPPEKVITTIPADQQLVPHQPPTIPALRAADEGVASFLESVLSDNTQRVYGTQWRIFTGWCDEVGLRSLPAEAPHRGPLPGPPRWLRRQHCHHALGHQRDLERP